METRSTRARWGAFLMALAGFGIVLYAIAFMVQDVTGLIELGLTPGDVGKTKEEIIAFSPRLFDYISHAQFALGAFIAASGVATVSLSFGVRRRMAWAWWGVVLTTAAWGISLIPHYIYGLASLSHLAPTYLALLLIVIGAYLSKPR